MVNSIVLNYLKLHHDKYPLEDLKKKILSKGYSKEDIEEAIKILGLSDLEEKSIKPQTPEKLPVKVTPLKDEKEEKSTKKGFRWMKLSGRIGAGFVILQVIMLIIILTTAFFVIKSEISLGEVLKIEPPSSDFSFLSFSFAITAVLLILVLLSLAFFYGFVVMGRRTGSKMLKASSWLIVAFIIISLIGIPVASTSLTSYSYDGQAVPGVVYNILLIAFGIFALWIIISLLLFFIGLLIVSEKIRFASTAGFLGFFLIVGIFGTAGFLLMNLGRLKLDSVSPLLIGLILAVVFLLYLVKILLISFLSLALLDGSNRFE
jgi:hypothetical protein